MTLYRKVVTGYTAQARFYAQHMERPNGEWEQAGWVPDRGGAKPVYKLLNGTNVAIYDGGHRSIVLQEIPATDIRTTEEACYEKRTS